MTFTKLDLCKQYLRIAHFSSFACQKGIPFQNEMNTAKRRCAYLRRLLTEEEKEELSEYHDLFKQHLNCIVLPFVRDLLGKAKYPLSTWIKIGTYVGGLSTEEKLLNVCLSHTNLLLEFGWKDLERDLEESRLHYPPLQYRF